MHLLRQKATESKRDSFQRKAVLTERRMTKPLQISDYLDRLYRLEKRRHRIDYYVMSSLLRRMTQYHYGGLENARELLDAYRKVRGHETKYAGKPRDDKRDWVINEPLAILAKNGLESAKVKLIAINMRMIHSVIKAVGGQDVQEDLEKAGVWGMLRAANLFNPHKSAKFATYAISWVRTSIQRELIVLRRLIRLPVHVWEKSHKVYGFIASFRATNKEEPSIEEISRNTNIPPHIVKRILKIQNVTSLDKPTFLDEDARLMDFVKDTPAVSNENKAENMVLSELLEKVGREKLGYRNFMIIKFRFGLGEKKTIPSRRPATFLM